jgi:hypothetical protein
LHAPQPVADDHLQFIAWDLRFLVELLSELRVQTEHAEILGGDSESVEVFGFAGVAGELPVSARERGKGVEGFAACAEAVQPMTQLGRLGRKRPTRRI